jgi:hypothetical protein
MSYIKTWVERCDEHPDHQSGMVSNGMIQARMQEEIDDLREEIEKLRDVLRRVVVYPSGDRAARVAFVSVGCQISFPLHPQTTWALELLVEFDQARRAALEGKP